MVEACNICDTATDPVLLVLCCCSRHHFSVAKKIFVSLCDALGDFHYGINLWTPFIRCDNDDWETIMNGISMALGFCLRTQTIISK